MVMKQKPYTISIRDFKTSEDYSLEFCPVEEQHDRPGAPTVFEVSLKNAAGATLGTIMVNFDTLLDFQPRLNGCLDHFRK